jgi:DNA-binding transcriptional LysR family regulator
MELRQLRYFVAVAEERHFGRAADRMGIAQSPLSRQVRSLERELGVALLERSTRRVDLTPAGQVLLERGLDILRDIDQATSAAALTAAGRVPVRLGCVPCVGSALTGHLLRLVRGEAGQPAVELQASCDGPALLAAVTAGDTDLAVFCGAQAPRAASIRTQRLFSDQVVAVLPAGSHALAGDGPVRLADLSDQPFVCFPDDSGAGDGGSLRRWCARAGYVPDIAATASELDALLGLVTGGLGCALLPRSACVTAPSGAVVRRLAEPTAVAYALAWRGAQPRPCVRRIAARLQRSFTPAQPAGPRRLDDIIRAGSAAGVTDRVTSYG